MAGKRKPWDRQDNEGEEAFGCFVVYRDMGPERSLTAAAYEAEMSRGQMADHSRKHDWVRRVAAWSRRKDQAKTRATLDELERMHRRHVRLSLQLQDLTGLELERLLARKERDLARGKKDDGHITSGNELSKIVERAVRIERLSRGEVTERVETHFDLSNLSVDELRELKRLRQKMGAHDEGETDEREE